MLYSFIPCRFVSVGPRLSSFLLDDEDDDLDMSECKTLIPIRDDQTLQVCGYPLHDLQTKHLTQLPPEIVFAEYGVQVIVLSFLAPSLIIFSSPEHKELR